MTDQPAINLDHLDLDADGRLDQDLICLKCGYNLRGLSPEGRCPECGTAVGRSLYGDRLQYCDPAWLNRLVTGMQWIWWSAILFLLVPVHCVLICILPSKYYGDLAGSLAPLSLHIFVVCVMGLIGIWYFATPNPDMLSLAKDDISRIILGKLPVPTLSVIIAFLFACEYQRNMAVELFLVCSIILIVSCILCFLYYARTLARRAKECDLSRNTTVAIWVLSLIVPMVLIVFSNPSRSVGFGSLYSMIAQLALVFLLPAILFFVIWYIRLIYLYKDLLRHVADYARHYWPRHPLALVQPPDHR